MLYSCICDIIVICKCHKPYNDNINNILRSNNHCFLGLHNRVGGDVQGCKCTPKSSDFVKIREKSRDVWAKYVKTFAKSLKNLGKLPKNTIKMVSNVLSVAKLVPNHMKTFFWRYPKSGLHAMYERWPTIFPCKFRKILAKILRTLKMCVLLQLWHYISLCFPHATRPALSFLHITWPTTKSFVQPSKKC